MGKHRNIPRPQYRPHSKWHLVLLCLAGFLWGIDAPAFVAVVRIDNYYYDRTGEQKDHSAARCYVSVTTNNFFIRPERAEVFKKWNTWDSLTSSVPKEPTYVYFVWARSPFCPTNFISALANRSPGAKYSPTSKYDTVILANHPGKISGDVYSQLPRFAYVDRLRCCPDYSTNDYFYLHIESDPYEPKEITFIVTFDPTYSSAFPDRVRAESPDYIPASGRPVRFKGDVKTRILWEYRVSKWQKFQDAYYPSEFDYVRYTDVRTRVEKENLIPIVKEHGALISIKDNGEESITNRFAPVIQVEDLRPLAGYGLKLSYSLTNSFWPEEGSDLYKRMIQGKNQN